MPMGSNNPEMEISSFSKLREACNNAESYPENITLARSPGRVLAAQSTRLQKDAKRIFNAEISRVSIREAPVGEKDFETFNIVDIDYLRSHLDKHLQAKQKDPKSRHVFIPAENNRTELLCTEKIFKYLCSYQQISPNFLKLVHSLGNQDEHLKFHAVGFFEEIVPKISSGRELDLPEIGRSGFELRNYYQLQAMEMSKNAGDNWTIRQTTVYHTFDLETARCFWITIKADKEIKNRVVDSTKNWEQLQPQVYSNLAESFSASLLMHLIHLEWCSEGWRQAIDDQEIRFRDILRLAKGIVLRPQAPQTLPHRLSSTLTEKQPSEAIDQRSEDDSIGAYWLRWTSRKLTGQFKQGQLQRTRSGLQDEAQDALKDSQKQAADVEKYDKILKNFSINQYQDLTGHTLALQGYKLAMTLNIEILSKIRSSYDRFIESRDCPSMIRTNCAKAVDDFSRRLQSIELELSIECQRAETLISQLQEGKPLYDSLLQFRAAEMNKLMAFDARYASRRMELVGERTETLTSSMHIITFLTLILLPGTFLGSFFSTDIIKSERNRVKLDEGLGILFVEICAPMMVVALLSWALYLYINKRRRSKLQVAYLEPGSVV